MHVKKDADGKVKGRKHWELCSRDLHDKLSVRVSEESLKSHRGQVVAWSQRSEAKNVDWKEAREEIKIA